jgi:hypothetical protein
VFAEGKSLTHVVLVGCLQVMSCNELGFEDLAAAAAKGAAPVVVFVASSTGDGDSPDNAAKFFATLK